MVVDSAHVPNAVITQYRLLIIIHVPQKVHLPSVHRIRCIGRIVQMILLYAVQAQCNWFLVRILLSRLQVLQESIFRVSRSLRQILQSHPRAISIKLAKHAQLPTEHISKNVRYQLYVSLKLLFLGPRPLNSMMELSRTRPSARVIPSKTSCWI